MSGADEQSLRKELIEYGLKAYQSGFVTETEGNISVRVSKERVLVSRAICRTSRGFPRTLFCSTWMAT